MPQEPVIVAVDVGTSSLKAALIAADGGQAAFARELYPAWQSGVSAADWENALAAALPRLFADAAVRGPQEQSFRAAGAVRPAAVCISANGPTFVPVAFDGGDMRPLLWNEGGLVRRGARSLFLAHAARFAAEEPRLYEQTRWLFSAQEWLSYKLGAEPVTILPQEEYRPFYWDDEQIGLFGLDAAKFPPFAVMGAITGRVSARAADRYGLEAGIPIIGGGPDFIMALIGAGAIEDGIVCDRAGTSEGVNLCSASPLRPAPAEAASLQAARAEAPLTEAAPTRQAIELRVLPHIKSGLWNIGGIIPSSGRLFDEYRARTGQENRGYAELLRDIMEKKGEGFDVLTGMAMQVRAVLETFAQNGRTITEMRVSGGQGKNPLWNRLKADLTGCALIVPEIADGELAGDAALAAAALGEAASVGEAATRIFREKARYEPAEATPE